MTDLYAGPVIDAHHHLWNLPLGRHPWITTPNPAMASLGDLAFLRRDYLPADFLADAGAANLVDFSFSINDLSAAEQRVLFHDTAWKVYSFRK